jgi:hypothetical protein
MTVTVGGALRRVVVASASLARQWVAVPRVPPAVATRFRPHPHASGRPVRDLVDEAVGRWSGMYYD